MLFDSRPAQKIKILFNFFKSINNIACDGVYDIVKTFESNYESNLYISQGTGRKLIYLKDHQSAFGL